MEPNNQTTIEGSKSHGALIGSIIIIVILIIGGVYLWNKSMKDKEIQKQQDAQNKIEANSTGSIEADLNNIDLESLDTGI